MEVALTMVRLRWALTLATLRKSRGSSAAPYSIWRVITSLRGGCTGCCTSR